MKDLRDRATPLFSIISVTKDDFPGIKRTVESVQAQTLKSFEQIIQEHPNRDDALEKLVQAIPSVKYHRENDSGMYDAMNRGFAKARGEWVLFLNGGDYFYENQTLERLSALLRDMDELWAYGGLELQMPDRSWQLRDSIVDVRKVYWARDWFPHPSIVAKRSLFEKVGGYTTSFGVSADQEWALRLHRSCGSVAVPFTVSCLTYGGMSASISLWNREREFRRIRCAHEEFLFRSGSLDQLATWVLFLWRCVKLRFLGGSSREPLRGCFSTKVPD